MFCQSCLALRCFLSYGFCFRVCIPGLNSSLLTMWRGRLQTSTCFSIWSPLFWYFPLSSRLQSLCKGSFQSLRRRRTARQRLCIQSKACGKPGCTIDQAKLEIVRMAQIAEKNLRRLLKLSLSAIVKKRKRCLKQRTSSTI